MAEEAMVAEAMAEEAMVAEAMVAAVQVALRAAAMVAARRVATRVDASAAVVVTGSVAVEGYCHKRGSCFRHHLQLQCSSTAGFPRCHTHSKIRQSPVCCIWGHNHRKRGRLQFGEQRSAREQVLRSASLRGWRRRKVRRSSMRGWHETDGWGCAASFPTTHNTRRSRVRD